MLINGVHCTMFAFVYTEVEGDQWRIQDFLEGAPTPGQLTYTWSNLCRKLHGHEKIGL